MIERPILFSGPMVRAIPDGRKTQTRRVVKPQPETNPSVSKIFFGKHPFSPSCFRGTPAAGLVGGSERMAWVAEDWCGNAIGVEEEGWLKCPYGQPGDRLWVRETWAPMPGGPVTPANGVLYRADGHDAKWLWRPSIFMPRWACRIVLEIEAVRVERVQHISESDALSEGCEPIHGTEPSGSEWTSYAMGYRGLWDSINAKRGFGWDTNPWVWVIQFKRTE